MTQRLFRAGDRVRVQASRPDGWTGSATVSHDQYLHDPVVDFKKDDPDAGKNPSGFAHWSKLELIAPVDNEAPTPLRGRCWALW